MSKPTFNTIEFDDPLLGTIAGPVWQDGCDHPKQSFVASFSILDHRKQTAESFDLYVFENRGHEVCIRYGNEPSQYISPGSLGDFLTRSQAGPVYAAAAKILLHKGNCYWMAK